MIFRPAGYVWTVGATGVAVVAISVIQLLWFPIPSPWVALVLAALALVSGATVLRLPFSAVRHLGELNRMNRATIEAFATAVDAKDQVTHGHIRRVQTYCRPGTLAACR